MRATADTMTGVEKCSRVMQVTQRITMIEYISGFALHRCERVQFATEQRGTHAQAVPDDVDVLYEVVCRVLSTPQRASALATPPQMGTLSSLPLLPALPLN